MERRRRPARMRRMSRRVRWVGPSSSGSRGVGFGLGEGGGGAVGCWEGALLLVGGMLVLDRRFEDDMVVEGGRVVDF